MALRAGRRPDVGERMAAGNVRPVSTRLIVSIAIGTIVLVTAAILALIIASNGTKTSKIIDNNVPHRVTPSGSATP